MISWRCTGMKACRRALALGLATVLAISSVFSTRAAIGVIALIVSVQLVLPLALYGLSPELYRVIGGGQESGSAEGIFRYVAFDVAPGAGAAALAAMRTLGIAGLSVTMPHKQDVAAADGAGHAAL